MKKSTNPLDRIRKNARRLIPYIGALFVAAGIIGLLFVQGPLQTSQDSRSDAATQDQLRANQLPSVRSELRVPFVVNKTGEFALHLDNAGLSLTRVNLIFNISNRDLDTPEVSVNQGSGFDAEKIEVEQIADGYLIKVTAIPNNLNWLVEPADKSLVRVKLVPRKLGNVVVNFDQDRTYASTRNLEVLIKIPAEFKYSITGSSSNQQQLCTQSGGTWREFSDGCADSCEKAANPGGVMCTMAFTMGCDCGVAQCWNGTSCANNPNPNPSPSPTPAIDCSQFKTSQTCSTNTLSPCAWYACASACHPRGTDTQSVCPPEPVIQGCNEACSNNSQCQVGMRCYSENGQSRCRLATNPTSSSCQASDSGNNQATLRSCNQSCSSNAECVTGLTCWSGTCRNPENSQSTSCAAPTTQQSALTINGCAQPCSTNAQCAINLRCYEGECRLATNPSSTSCSAVTKQTVSTTYSKKASGAAKGEIIETDTPIQKGENLTPDSQTDTQYEKPTNELAEAERKIYDESYQADETLFGLVRNLLSNSDSKLPLFIILFGVMLLILSILASILSRSKKSPPVFVQAPGHTQSHTTTHSIGGTQVHTPQNQNKINLKTYDVKPVGTVKNPAAKELLKTLENQPKD